MVRRLNKYWSQAAREEAGFTLVEQIVTLVIVTMVLTAAMAALATGSLGLNVTTSRNEAMNLAQAQMECIKNQDFVGIDPDLCNIPLPSGYGLRTDIDQNVCPGASPDPNYDVDQVHWIEVSVSRGSNDVLCLQDLKVDRP